jgi:hypothetical protein
LREKTRFETALQYGEIFWGKGKTKATAKPHTKKAGEHGKKRPLQKFFAVLARI